jgi:hypothetical protein
MALDATTLLHTLVTKEVLTMWRYFNMQIVYSRVIHLSKLQQIVYPHCGIMYNFHYFEIFLVVIHTLSIKLSQ